MKDNLLKYYKKLNLTDSQIKVLSSVTYDNCYIADAIKEYHKSKDYHNNISFCESLAKFVKDGEINRESIIEYIKQFNKNYKETEHDIPHLFRYCSPSFKPMQFATMDTISVNTSIDEPDKNIFDKSSIDDFLCYEQAPEEYCDEVMENYCDEVMENYCDVEAEENGLGFDSFIGSINHSEILKNTRTDRYEHIEEKGYRNVLNNPTSTFRTTCNNASLDILKSNILSGYPINSSMVRIEELLNYFNYNLTKPNKEKFSITTELVNKQFSTNKLFFIGIKGCDIIPKKQNIVILLDVSGSMDNYEEHVQAAIITIASKLSNGDKFSIITYSSEDNTVIDDITFHDSSIDYIIERLLQVEINGCTYGSKGLESAYKLINKNKIDDGINRVVIITDGDFNFGDCNIDSIKNIILEKKETGAYLSVIGTGLLNTNDELMNTLAKNGNGNYCYINSIEDVENNILNDYNNLMFSIAKDVKAQVEFNPKYVKSYRLIGYENREISHEDFRDDNVIAEPFGSGSHAIAVYDLELTDEINKIGAGLRYIKPLIIDSNELCTVSIRYKDIETTESNEISQSIEYNVSDMSYNTKLAYIIYTLGEKLRQSSYVSGKEILYAKALLEELIEYDEIDKNKATLLTKLYE